MKMIGTIVNGQFVFFPVQIEPPFGDSIRITSRNGAEEWMALGIGLKIIEAEHHAAHFPTTIGNLKFSKNRAKRHDFGRQTVLVDQRVKVNDLAPGCFSKQTLLNAHLHDRSES